MPEALHRILGLTDDEHREIVGLLAREPNEVELAVYSVMWSEHCSYKSSRAHLRHLPSEAPWVVVGPGSGAGIVDIGDGWLAALRIESHNHPSFVEPHQGAATGVGGILRDVLSMGARPVALLDQIRFGELDGRHNRYLFDGVVGGIAAYGNAVGVPTIGGEADFDASYDDNPLVNVMCLGLVRREAVRPSGRPQDGNVAVLLGGLTGRDGIGGASTLASAAFTDGDAKRPSVQIGDPFEEKKLIEACLELCERNLAVAMQDLGAGGISCAAAEMAARAAKGIDLFLDAVPRRVPDMTPDEVLISESQERMLAIVDADHVEEVLDVASRWEVGAAVVGRITANGSLRAYRDEKQVADIPARSLSEGAPEYERPYEPPLSLDLWSREVDVADTPDVMAVLLRLLDTPSIADKSWIYEQYDHMLGLSTVVPPGHDAALLRVGETDKAVAMSADGHGRRCFLDPRRGAERLVHEAALNVAVTGAKPLAVVDNLNFGDPERPTVMWQFIEVVNGISAACRTLDVPVVGGNVSFYNATDGRDIHPTPVIGMLGVVDRMPAHPPRLDRGDRDMEIWLLGPADVHDFAGSDYAWRLSEPLTGRPAPADPAAARRAVRAAQLLASDCPVLHDVSRGGLAVAVAKICIRSQVGAVLEVGDWRDLYSEAPHRMLAAGPPRRIREVVAEVGIEARHIGLLGGDVLRFNGFGTIPLAEATAVWRSAIPGRLEAEQMSGV